MQLVTSCPACDTRFHVKPEQLAAHAGDLRCGQCQHVFNAGARLYEVLPPQSLVPLPEHHITNDVVIAPDESSSETFDSETFDAVAPPHAGTIQDDSAFVVDSTAESTPPPASADDADAIADIDAALARILDINQGESVDTEAEAYPVLAVDTDTDDQPLALPEANIAEEPETPIEPPVTSSFLAPEQPSRKRRFSPWLTIPLSLLLVLVLLAQAAYLFRSQIAGYWPASRPALSATCQWLGCTVPLPRNAELLALDDSDLQEDFEHPDVIQLATKLLNNASYTQAYPMLELTLTDEDDKPKLRRIFAPEEYLPAGTDLQAGLPAGEEIQINLAFSTSGETVSGYRVFVTY